MKKLIAAALSLILTVCCLLPALTENEQYTVAVAQFATHGSLDNCREGFLLGLKENGFVEGENLTVLTQNAQADMSLAASIAANFVSADCDLICAIATPMAVCAYNAADDQIPVVYSAVSAPIQAGLANEDGTPAGNVTGTSDLLNYADQLAAIRALLPQAKTIGILYTIGEANSLAQLAEYQKIAEDYGFTVVDKGIATGSDIALALPALIPQVDCLNMLTDNTVVSYLDVVLDAADVAGIPVFGSEIEQVKLGSVAAVGLDYIELGRRTGEIAARVLKGENAADIPFLTISDSELYINKAACAVLDIVIPGDIAAKYTEE